MPHSETLSPEAAGSVQPGLEECASPSSYLGLRNGAVSPRSTPKSVSYAPQAEIISPLILGTQKSVEDLNTVSGRSPRKLSYRSSRPRPLSGRRSIPCSPALEPLASAFDGSATVTLPDNQATADQQTEPSEFDKLIDQVSSWIKHKRAKRSRRKGRSAAQDHETERGTPKSLVAVDDESSGQRRDSDASDESLDLDQLERIVKQNLGIRRSSIRRGSTTLRHKTSIRKLLRKQSSASELESLESDLHVPSCDAFLDNSRTLAYTGGASDMSDESGTEDLQRVASRKDFDAWAKFKFEVVRLAHTLKLKGWRKVPLEMSSAIEVQRLSGALTNAVYVVSPPKDLPLQKEDHAGNAVHSKVPPKLLLRIYGPQVEHLIDRESELAILRRLARKRIGPRLLGTFGNGRFEEYLNAKPLTPEDLRDPSTSRQIAKRMRELHEGIELLDQERSDGAFVWRNWDKWLDRVDMIMTWLDAQVLAMEPGAKPHGTQAWMRRGLICGVPWKQFRDTAAKHRSWLKAQYGGSDKVRDDLIFAHNDTQYGNLLRVVPTGESPLLLPANTHKQLVVIDFEYANANTRGHEFANHFTEWCYDYHDERKPYAFSPSRYPTPVEQDRFIRAYVQHRPEFQVATPNMGPTTPSATPSCTPATSPLDASKRSTTSITEFMLDARTPQVQPLTGLSHDACAKASEDAEVERLMRETRMWRMANSAQWVAWGLVQAKVPGMPLSDAPASSLQKDDTDPAELLGERADEYRALTQERATEDEPQEEEFDYLGYAQHRALFFWGDAIRIGLIKAEELPEETRSKLKSVPY